MKQEDYELWLKTQVDSGFPELSLAARQFAIEMIECRDHLLAADLAQIPRNQAMKMWRHPLVQAFMAYLNEKRTNYSLIDSSFIEVQYLSLFNKLMGNEEVPMVDKDGTAISRKKFHASEAVAALGAMAKAVDFFGDSKPIRLEHTGKDGAPIQTQNVRLTREELIEEAKRRGLPTSIFADE